MAAVLAPSKALLFAIGVKVSDKKPTKKMQPAKDAPKEVISTLPVAA